jgi:hypothetical protein
MIDQVQQADALLGAIFDLPDLSSRTPTSADRTDSRMGGSGRWPDPPILLP